MIASMSAAAGGPPEAAERASSATRWGQFRPLTTRDCDGASGELSEARGGRRGLAASAAVVTSLSGGWIFGPIVGQAWTVCDYGRDLFSRLVWLSML